MARPGTATHEPTPDEVVLLNEMNHDFRIVPLDGSETPGLANILAGARAGEAAAAAGSEQ